MAALVDRAERDGQTALIVLSGLAGVGKTGLAIRFLREQSARLEGGELYGDLRGFSAEGPLDPGEMLDIFLRALGLEPATIPPDLATRAAWFRSVTADRRLVILLDNAASSAQVRAMLPGVGRHVVVVTSRVRLAGLSLDGAEFVRVAPLDQTDTVDLLQRLVGAGRTAEEPAATRRIAEICAGLPIAVNAVAVQIAERTTDPLADTVRELTERTRGLASLSPDGEETPPLRAAFDLSYAALGEAPARLYRRLSWHPGPDITRLVLRALGDGSAEGPLRRLIAASLIEETAPGVFRLHDLIRRHAHEKAQEEEDTITRLAAMDHLLQTYRRQALAADRKLRPYITRYRRPAPEFEGVFGNEEAAIGWLERERGNLVKLTEYAVDHRSPREAIDIAEGLWPLYIHRSYARVWLDAASAALRAARSIDDEFTQARILDRIGQVHGRLCQEEQAQDALDQAERIWARRGERGRLAQTQRHRGLLALDNDRVDAAIIHFTAALRLDEGLNRPHNTALTLIGLGRAHNRAARYPLARLHLERALRLLEEPDDPHNRALALVALAEAVASADPQAATSRIADAMAELRARNSKTGQAAALEGMANIAARHGRTDEARDCYAGALEILEQLGDRLGVERLRRARQAVGSC
ncbi:tetratricopeptide repeat protein [Marinactinospora rubrisoli]|uniref:Tetratricopeptide repeat protein n=1 Tax=Marinactinospora rubrisoli TaxID=2715399 RepID=A0ABW2KIF2_9ACTN